MKKKVGLYGGTFDPIHFGHLNLAIQLAESQQLNEVWVIPAAVSPFKSENRPTPAKHRLKMVELAIQGIPNFKVLDIEIAKEGPSYTVETLRTLTHQHKDIQFYLMLGNDCVPDFVRWRNPAEIISMASLLIGKRSPSDYLKDLKGDPSVCEAIRNGMVETRLVDVSATEIRERIRKKMYCGHLLPTKVIDYIALNSLYS